MTDTPNTDRPPTAPTPRRRRPTFAQPANDTSLPPLDELAPLLDPPWQPQTTTTPEHTATYTHPDGHTIGLRIQPGGHTIQAWITAGPDLPPIPKGTPEAEAEARAANDARLQPGHTWHTTLTTRGTTDLPAALETILRERLIPALTCKPKHLPGPASRPATGTETDPDSADQDAAADETSTPSTKGTPA